MVRCWEPDLWEMRIRNLLQLLKRFKNKDTRKGMVILAFNYSILHEEHYSYLSDQIERDVQEPTLDGMEEWLKNNE